MEYNDTMLPSYATLARSSAPRGAFYLLFLAVLLVSTIPATALAAAIAATTSDDALDPTWISALRGNYQLPSGEVAYLGGWPAHGWRARRLFVEIAGERHRLHAVSPNRLVNDTGGDTLRVRVGAAGEILGLEWPEGSGAVAPRVELYAVEELSFQSGGHTLAGSLFLPAGSAIHPAIVLVHGSGPDTRDPYRNLADHFARNGVAALIYDKRGLGGSSGDWREAGFEDLAADAVAAVRWLRERPEVDASGVGLWGISQGGWIVPVAASQSSEVAFAIAVSGSGFSPAVQEMWRVGNNLRYRSLSPATIEIGIKGTHLLYSLKPLFERGLVELPADLWFRSLDLDLAPGPVWEQVRQPILGIWGEIDGLVPTFESVAIVRDALDRAGNAHYTLRVFPGADHGIVEAVEGFQNESLGQYVYASGYLEMMTDWIHGLASSAAGARVLLPEEPTPTRLGWHGISGQPTPAYGTVPVQIPMVAAFGLLFLGFGIGGIAGLVRRARRSGLGKGSIRVPVLAGAVAVFGTMTIVGWGATLVSTILEGGDPFVLGHPLSLTMARVAAVIAILAWIGLVRVVAARSYEQGSGPSMSISIAWVALALGGGAFAHWAWYWQLLPGL